MMTVVGCGGDSGEWIGLTYSGVVALAEEPSKGMWDKWQYLGFWSFATHLTQIRLFLKLFFIFYVIMHVVFIKLVAPLLFNYFNVVNLV